jgi:hypothetical protein
MPGVGCVTSVIRANLWVCREIEFANPTRVRWEDGHESIVTPAAGAARIEPKK